MEQEFFGWFFILFNVFAGFLVDIMVLDGFTNVSLKNLRKFILGTINYGILTMLPFMSVFFLFNDNGNLEIGEIFAVTVILAFPLGLIYFIRNFRPYIDFLQKSILDLQTWWKDMILLILFAGVLYSMYYYGIIISLII